MYFKQGCYVFAQCTLVLVRNKFQIKPAKNPVNNTAAVKFK